MLFVINIIAAIVVVGLVIWSLLGSEKAPHRSVVIAAIAFIVGLAIFGNFFLESRKVERGLRVVGYASKQFESDMVKWNLVLQKDAGSEGLKEAYRSITKDVNDFKAYLVEKGMNEEDIGIQPPTSSPYYNNFGQITGYNVNQSLYVLSHDISRLEAVALDPSFFADRGLLMQRNELEYLYSKLPELKKELIGAATKDALDRAKEVTSSAKTRLGKLKTARSGVFQITEPYSTDVSDYGFYNTQTKAKSISVTVTAEFEL
ncbi:MAG TPA: SIMPL domain-containing protein [Candidatus Cloacimonetes bacterium]|jgi:hypothetical protein|nr:SIMPL domain-containing protein [Candidatus Cloacimonadota bacterium]